MKALIIDNFTYNTPYLERLLDLQNIDYEIVDAEDFSTADVSKNLDFIVLSGGSSISVLDHHNPFTQEIALLKSPPLPVLGICLGCQLIGDTFDSKLEDLGASVHGKTEISMLETEHPIFTGIENLSVFESHRWAITELGPELRGLARSEYGYEIIMHCKLPIWGFQFHPERLTGESMGDELFANWLKVISQ